MQQSKQFKQMSEYIEGLQEKICSKISQLDGEEFHEDVWKHHSGGGGRSRIIENGNLFEKGGVNISAVSGKLPQEIASHFDKKTHGILQLVVFLLFYTLFHLGFPQYI